MGNRKKAREFADLAKRLEEEIILEEKIAFQALSDERKEEMLDQPENLLDLHGIRVNEAV